MASTTLISKFAHLQIPLEDVLKATNNFHQNKIISQGGFGPAYKGQLLRSGKLIKIAARRLDRKIKREGDVEFWTEISVLSDLNHTNLISLIGFCDEKNEKIIVTTYEAKGSVKEYLKDPNLTWTQRLRVCVGVARALSYLRYDEGREYGVIHLNINSNTVLLDRNWEAKLSGFEFSIKQPANRMDQVVLSDPVGAIGYEDPAIEKSRGVTHKSDIYSFGVVLFEILCGREATYIKNKVKRSLTRLAKHHYEKTRLVDVISPDLWNQMSPQSFLIYSNVAYSCLKEESTERPDVDYIIAELEKAFKLQLRRENLGKNLDHLKISLSDIKLATSNFSETYTIASWDYSTLYRAELDHFDTESHSPVEGDNKGKSSKRHSTVLILRFLPRDDVPRREEVFYTNVEMLNSVKHRNIDTILGFCFEGSELIYVSANVSNGYLADHLGNHNDMRVLTWEKRLKICIDVAHALNYLHSEMEDQNTIIHCCISSHTIGLEENWRAKVIDFGGSLFLPPNQEDEALYLNLVFGMKYYRDPEYEKTGKLKRESDVHSFGVVLFEVLCWRPAYDPVYINESERGLVSVARQRFRNGTLEDIIDPIIKGESDGKEFLLNGVANKDSLDTFIKIAYQCVEETQEKRPTMKTVIKELEKALIFEENKKNNLRMSLEDIKLATQNFNDDNCIGRGSFGNLYTGKVPQGDGFNTVVIQRFDTGLSEREQQFLEELQILCEFKHDNIYGLVGYCDEKDEKIIVFEDTSRGSLDRYLNDPSLTWMKRLNICIDVAKALDFLHGREGNVKMHWNIKTASIVLNNDWKAKVAGFGLSLISPHDKDVNDHVCGTSGYIKQSFLTKECGIYTFGVVLFEILCGRSTLEKHEGHYLPDFIRNKFEEGKHDEVVFEQIKNEITPKSLTMFRTIAYLCLQHDKEKRPTTKEVLVQLRKALELQEEVQHPNMDQVVDRPQKTLGNQGMKLQQASLSDMKLATANFSDASKFFVSGDDFSMYRAIIDYKDGHSETVLIKRYPSGPHVLKEVHFFTEIEMLASVKHPNIVTAHAFCFEGSEMILVTENVSGYLGHYLGNFNNMLRILTWEKRLKICIDVAHALHYLHYEMEDQKVMINGDINCYNIALDENLGAKIVDFWYSVFLPPNQPDEAIYRKWTGRSSYVDPEYEKTGRLKRESDVYSFGVVLLEVLCGRKSIDPIYTNESDKGLAHVARQSFSRGTLEHMIDPILKEETYETNFVLNKGPNKDSLHTFIEIANQCVVETQDQRPTMKVVVKELEKALLLQKYNKDNLRISLEDIIHATQDFHHDSYIGGGGFGRVYKGNIQDGDGFKTIVAKRLDKTSKQGEKEFLSELQILLEYKHENLIGLVGYCDEKDEKVIVYEYASRGSLDKYLSDEKLRWVERLNICIDVASALYFLHGGAAGKQAKVIHRDIKTANILLNNDWKAKLADFGLSLISPLIQETDYVIDHACGTLGYLDPLYHKSGFLTIESDIYSFGVVLFEILCGRSTHAIRNQEGHYLTDFIKKSFEEGKHYDVVFEQIKNQIKPKSLTTFQKIAYQCLYHEREKRPTTKKVLMQLKKAFKFQNMASIMTKFNHLKIPLEDVVKATNNFHDDNIIGHDGFGTVYIGQLLQSGRLTKIAARRFDCKHGKGDLEFLTEISVLSNLKHTNIACIIGFCDDKDEKIIVTTYEPNGSLGQYLTSPNLTWTKRLMISVGVARVLSYLHYDEGRDYAIIHRNINSDTILLDESWEAKLSSFEFSIKHLVDHKDKVNLCEHIDTMGYMNPAIEKTGDVTLKSDIYSFGVVLFEMLCGMKAFIPNEANRSLATLVRYHYGNNTLQDIIYHDLKIQMSPQSLVKYVGVAYHCLKEGPTHRPDMDYIVARLEKALELQMRHENIGKKLEHLKIRLSDIKVATDDFSERHKFSVSFYYAWYRVKLDLCDKENPSSEEGKNEDELLPKRQNTMVIKRIIPRDDEQGEQVFFTEIEVLSSVKHRNIVTLVGFCVQGRETLLVIENVSNVSLGTHLENVNAMRLLTWERRLKICVDVARALNYLHCEMQEQKMIILRELSSYDILLDANSWEAKIAWFGNSIFMPLNQEDEYPCLNENAQTRYHIDPEYKMTRKLTRQSDVYSFGVVLLEILCGRLANDPVYLKEGDEGLASMARQSFCTGTLEEMIDPIIKEETTENNFVLNIGPNKDSLRTFTKLAYQCVAETQDRRPTMKTVVKELEKALFFQVNNKDNPRITLKDLKLATQNFHDDNCVGGEGYERVYKGNLQDGDGVNMIVAKRLDWRSGQGLNRFQSEIHALWEYKHENIIGLVGYCDEYDESIIVYEYASRGSLDRYLNDTSLTWIQRLSICIDVATALDFIYGVVGKQAKMIHRDIKTANILLNHEWKAKLADFGLSIISPISQESDICSFGVVLFEILCGRTFAIHEQEGQYLPDFVKNLFEGKHDEAVFEQIREHIEPKSLTIFQKIAYQCMHHRRENPPTTKEILRELKKALEIQVSYLISMP